MSQNNTPISFWQLLKEYTLVIPIIQRDYAQGRRGKEQLRKRFFRQLIEAVVDHKRIILDFIYGTPDTGKDKVIYPLDGQQRLTSLWLLYWYVAFRAGKLKDSGVCSMLQKFTYETRTSSRDFCHRVCQELFGENKSVAELIRDQPWFSRRFRMDPTVQAMLRSLSDEEEHGCGFEQMLGDVDYNMIWDILVSEDCPVQFYFRSTENEGTTNSYNCNNSKDKIISNPDDLYIKMNARGKKLTDFENFKSELFSFKSEKGKELFRHEPKFIKNFENEWTNLFWTLRHEEKNIVDHIQFEFFNRMVLAHILVNGDIKNSDEELYKHISEHKNFSSIDVYRNALTPEFRDYFASVMDGITKLKKNGKELNAIFEDPYSFRYLPQYEYDEDKNKAFQTGNTNELFWVTKFTLADIVRFYAASLFFSQMGKNQSPFDESAFKNSFKDWMIFSRNMFDNSGIAEYADAKNILNLFAQIGGNCLNIISFLCSEEAEGLPVPGDLLKAQYTEERTKANKIQECRTENLEQSYVQIIRKAEKEYPFGGAIRFLFTNENGDTDWSDFTTKNKHFNEIIDKKEKHLSPLALRTLLSYVKTWETLTDIWDIDSSYDSWKRILLRKPTYIKPVHLMLLNGIDEEKLKSFESPIKDNEIQKGTHEELVKSKFLHLTTWDSFTFRANHTAMVWNSRAPRKRYMLGTPRNRLLAEGIKNKEINMIEDSMLDDGEHFLGECLLFELANMPSEKFVLKWNGTEFHRTEIGENDVYVCKRDNEYPYFPNDKRDMFAIKVAYNCTYEDFINNLVKLLEKAEKYQSSGFGE